MPAPISSTPWPYERAFTTGRWAGIIFRALSTRVAKRWRFVSFHGAKGGDWRGVVDVLAVRKDTSEPNLVPLKRGDLFDIVLVQVKGGSASLPTIDDRHRLLRVKGYYHARDVVLFRWRRNKSAQFYIFWAEPRVDRRYR